MPDSRTIVSAEHYPIGFEDFIESVLNDDIATMVWNGIKNAATASARGNRSADRLALILVRKRHSPAISAAREQFKSNKDGALPYCSREDRFLKVVPDCAIWTRQEQALAAFEKASAQSASLPARPRSAHAHWLNPRRHQ